MPKFNFLLKNRLRQPSDFNRVFKNGLRISSRHFIFFYLPNNQQVARLGIVASKRKCRLSVDRNHVRRLVREAFRHHQHDMIGFDLIVLLKAPVKDSRDPILTCALDKQFEKCIQRINAVE